MAPKISIIMNCRNGAEYLSGALQSIRAQTFTDWEIIFWDNLSTDKSPEIAKAFGPRLRYFRSESPLPIGGARQKAIEKAEGEFIAFLDTDDEWRPEHLDNLLARMGAGTDAVYSNLTVRDEAAKKEYEPFNPKRDFHEGDVRAALAGKSFIWLQASLIRASAIKKLGIPVFDPELLTAEDLDFFLRLSFHSKFGFSEKPTLIYRVHPKSITSGKRHYFAHDFSYLLYKYRDILTKKELRSLARQYLYSVRIDLGAIGYKAFPFLRLGFSLKQIGISALFLLFPGKNTLEIMEAVKKPLSFLKPGGRKK